MTCVVGDAGVGRCATVDAGSDAGVPDAGSDVSVPDAGVDVSVLDAGRDASATDTGTPGDARDATVAPDVSADVVAVDGAADVTGPMNDATAGDVGTPEPTPDGAADVVAETSTPRDAAIDRVVADARADGSSRGDASDGSVAQGPAEDDSGCSCRTTRRTGSLGMYMLLGFAGALAIRRRRRSR
jgi:MYXO-CTERM domain-containing protein